MLPSADCTQGRHEPGKHGKALEFESGQGKSQKIAKSQENSALSATVSSAIDTR